MSTNNVERDLRPYHGRKASLLTQHGKEQVIGPVLRDAGGCEVVRASGFDTDLLGTFSRDVPRFGSQVDAARKKARIGMALTGLEIGIASEGAFSRDPYTGFFAWNYELVILVDDAREIELSGVFSGPAQSESGEASDWEEVLRLAERARFPSHQLVIRPDTVDDPEFRKGIHTTEALRSAFEWAMNRSTRRKVFVENDLRAHANPTRMANIEKAAMHLVAQMNSTCPMCSAPGYWARELKTGLPCRVCGHPTRELLAQAWGCQKCGCRTEKQVSGDPLAEPGRCDFCNP